MNAKHLIRRTLRKHVHHDALMDKSRTLVLDLSRARVTMEEAATLAFNSRDLESSYNRRRDLLILEFNSPREKLKYMKRLPQWCWNRGCILWDCSNEELDQWAFEAMG
jgi:hypothetical protein